MSPIPIILSEQIAPDIFILDNSQKKFLYSPRRGRFLEIKKDEGYKRIKHFYEKKDDTDIEDFLREIGFLSKLEEISAHRPLHYQPSNLTLSLTSNCNLRCKYCYAYAGSSKKDLSWAKIEKAIRLTVKNNQKLNKEKLKVVFHGGGEPFFRWGILQKATELINDLWPGNKRFSIVTNATLITDKRAKWLKENNFHLSVSLDGPKDVHDQQRVKANGEGSFDDCIQGITHLYKHNVHFGIRATVTQYNLNRLKELILIAKAFDCNLKVEPLTITGRASEEMSGISFEDYYNSFNEAKAFADDLGVSFASIYNHRIYTKTEFCSGNGNTFCLLPGGYISTCTRVTRIDDDLADEFIIGKLDEQNSLQIDNIQVRKLKLMTVSNFEQCKTCFAKWFCSGGCLHQRISNGGNMPEGHCKVMKAMLFDKLLEELESKGKEVR
ncbi:MAG: Radical SAM additional 4Fe4S-binding domain-containing protein [candidate division WS6 bacterium 34_10]|uniref:Radical SAM additional 4Fe4S-binding domain-containing protein n=1 Tax=candidate division WS6 bacterium 34_10 TaxID=1641389 RepID=A0A101HIW6_9BACT|nr:MAG: Radical SAM additional 4Fe4S-binding domain-containing protein [candidate division WS6 bacterium 34_10]